MSLNKYKIIIILTVSVLILGTNYSLLYKYFNINSEDFFSLYTLDKDGTTNNYFIEDSDIIVGNTTDWTITVENKMENVQYVKLIIKIFNSSNMNDDIYSGIPNSNPILYQREHYILDNNKWDHNIQWHIKEIEINNNVTEIKKIVINQQEITTSIFNDNSEDFIFLIELWPYNIKSTRVDKFMFTWESNGTPDCTWNKIWFNVVE